jgi:hypothetical protein
MNQPELPSEPAILESTIPPIVRECQQLRTALMQSLLFILELPPEQQPDPRRGELARWLAALEHP